MSLHIGSRAAAGREKDCVSPLSAPPVSCQDYEAPPVGGREYLNRFYFVLDSNDCRTPCHISVLYGWLYQNGTLYTNCDVSLNVCDIPTDSIGAFTVVQSQNDKIIVRSDWTGSCGLYLYRDGTGYFAVSNSFVYLAHFLKGTRQMTLNEDYARFFLTTGLCSLSVEETMINEIGVVPNENYLEITCGDRPSLTVKLNYRPEELQNVPLCSSQGLALLDQWRDKWAGFYASLIKSDRHLSVDIASGFDSRVAAAVLLSEHLDCENVCFNSAHDEFHTHAEDDVL